MKKTKYRYKCMVCGTEEVAAGEMLSCEACGSDDLAKFEIVEQAVKTPRKRMTKTKSKPKQSEFERNIERMKQIKAFIDSLPPSASVDTDLTSYTDPTSYTTSSAPAPAPAPASASVVPPPPPPPEPKLASRILKRVVRPFVWLKDKIAAAFSRKAVRLAAIPVCVYAATRVLMKVF